MGRRSIVLGGITFLLFAVGHASAVPVADLSVGKTGPATATAGTNITYTITVSNAGPSDAQSVALTDAVPAGTTFVSDTQISGPAFTCSNPIAGGTGTINCTITTLAASATSTFALVVDLLSSTPNGTIISNTANVSSTTFDPTSVDNSFTVSTTVARAAAVPEPSSLILLATGVGLASLAGVARRRHRRK